MTTPLLLLAEDEPLIALDWESSLEDVGYAIAGPFRSCSDILTALREITPDLALLDYTLIDGRCDEAIRELVRRDIPVVICSGSAPADEFKHVPLLDKPVRMETLLATVKTALESKTTKMVVGGAVMAGMTAVACFCEMGPHLHF